MAEHAVAELRATLSLLSPLLGRLSELLVAQRQAVETSNLQQLLAITVAQEEASVRLANLEQRRQALQQQLEVSLGADGLREIGERAFADADERAQFLDLVAEVGARVRRLHGENAHSAEMLRVAVDVTKRTRTFLARLSGAEPAYPAPAARAAVAYGVMGR